MSLKSIFLAKSLLIFLIFTGWQYARFRTSNHLGGQFEINCLSPFLEILEFQNLQK